MKNKFKRAFKFYLGDDYCWLSPDKIVGELNKKGFELNTDMVLSEIYEIVYAQYLKEGNP